MEEKSLIDSQSKKSDLGYLVEDQAYTNECMILNISKDGLITSITHKADIELETP